MTDCGTSTLLTSKLNALASDLNLQPRGPWSNDQGSLCFMTLCFMALGFMALGFMASQER